MTTSAAAALEAHRQTNGQFGEQPKADAGQLDLATDWVEDGTTPHPTGGYVAVVTLESGHTEYVDAEGKRHREDGPAVIWSGSESWYFRDQLHRTDGPAVTAAGLPTQWFRDGVRHRDDGPAVIYPSGTAHWYREGKLHRTDGPAIERPRTGRHEWWVDGVQVETPGSLRQRIRGLDAEISQASAQRAAASVELARLELREAAPGATSVLMTTDQQARLLVVQVLGPDRRSIEMTDAIGEALIPLHEAGDVYAVTAAAPESFTQLVPAGRVWEFTLDQP